MRVTGPLGVVLATAFAISASVSAQQRSEAECRAAGNSPLPEPSWYAAACGWMHKGASAGAANGVLRVPGDPAFHIDLRATPDNFQTFLLPNANAATTIAPTASQPFYGLEHDNGTGVLYAVDNTTKQLGTINKATAAFTSLVTITGMGAAETATGLAFQSFAGGPVYVSGTDGATSNLYTINTTTGAATLVGPMGTALMIDIAINNAGQMYGHDIGTDSLYSINTTTGAATLIGATGIAANFAQSIDFDKSTGVLYGWVYQGGGVNQFVQFNLATGAATNLNTPTNLEAEGALTPVELQDFRIE